MVTLKLLGPRRRESQRVKGRNESPSPVEPDPESKNEMTSKQATRRSPTRSTSMSNSPAPLPRKRSTFKPNLAASPPGDTIEVHHRTAGGTARNLTGDKSSEARPSHAHEQIISPVLDGSSSMSKQASIRKDGKSFRDVTDEANYVEMMDTDDQVIEYDFSNDADHAEDEDDGRDTMWYKRLKPMTEDVITISSDDDKDENSGEWDVNYRPWRDLDQQGRIPWEMMYCHVTDYPMHGDWAVTEEYQHQKDKEMLRYMEDFPLPEWVLTPHIVHDAYQRLLERTRWRSLGIRIYGRERIPSATPLQRSHSHGWQMPPVINGPSQHSQAMPPPAQHHSPGGHIAQNVPHSMHQPPPHQVLRSQPNAQPVPTQPNGLPIQPPVALPNISAAMPSHMPPIFAPQTNHSLTNPQLAKRRGRAKRTDDHPTDQTAALPPTPPYEKREKPTERKTSGKRNARRQAEAEEFPWNRMNIDFKAAKKTATWDESIYDPATLANMEATRRRNVSVIERIDAAESERQRATRSKRKVPNADVSSETEQVRTGGRKKSLGKLPGAEGSISDPYHSGHFEFTPKDQPKVRAFGKKTPDEIMSAVEDGGIAIDECADLMICWNPGKKGMTSDLEQARFSIKDTLLTRQQLAQTPVLIKRAAESIVDFCPDMLWRGMLLRIVAEAGYGNKQIRDRMCLNGNYCDKATITKRVGSALGQKQQQSGSRKAKKANQPGPEAENVDSSQSHAKADDEYYNENVMDFGDYVFFFGHRTSHRSQLQQNQIGFKRKAIVLDGVDDDNALGIRTKAKMRRKKVEETAQSPDVMRASDDVETSAVEGDASGSEEEVQTDAVSVQSDTILDQMEED